MVRYEDFVEQEIFAPLGMKSTSITLDTAMKERLAQGHDTEMNPTANWDLPTLAGAGALRSTANDMLTFLGAVMGLTKSPLAAPMASMLAVRRPMGAPGHEIGLQPPQLGGPPRLVDDHARRAPIGGVVAAHGVVEREPERGCRRRRAGSPPPPAGRGPRSSAARWCAW